MSLENFFGLDNAESSGSAEAAEKFREQMRKNGGAIKAMAGNQAKQKKKEDRLARILVKFIQDQGQTDLVFLIVKLLQENVPGAFILSVLSIASAELEKELELNFKEDLKEELISWGTEEELPKHIRDELNAWGDAILKAGLMMPGRTLQTVLTPERKLKSIVLDLVEYCLEEYFERHGMQISEGKVKQFALISIQSILVQLIRVNHEKSDVEIIETPNEPSENL